MIVMPLIKLTKKNVSWSWDDDKPAKSVFKTLKVVFLSIPIVLNFDPDKEIVVETNAFNNISPSIVSQYDSEAICYPIVFISKNHFLAKYIYEIYENQIV